MVRGYHGLPKFCELHGPWQPVPWQAFVHTPGKFTCIDMFAGQARI